MRWMTLVAVVCLVGCGGGGTGTSGSQSAPSQSSIPAPDLAGQWDFFVVSYSGQLSGSPVVANLQQQTSTSYFSTPASTLLFLLNSNGPAQLCAFDANDSGCDFPPNVYPGLVVNANLTGSSNQWMTTVQLPTAGTNTNSYNGLINLAASPQIQGNIAIGSQNGIFVGIKMPSFSGTYTGNLSAMPIPGGQGLSNFPVSVSMTLNQDKNYNITGNATFTMSGCSQTATFSNSAAVGGTAYLNSSTGLQMQLMQAWPVFNTDPTDSNPSEHSFELGNTITGEDLNVGQIDIFYSGSICGANGGQLGNGGQGTITLQPSAQSATHSN
jgi:hypothetical protein